MLITACILLPALAGLLFSYIETQCVENLCSLGETYSNIKTITMYFGGLLLFVCPLLTVTNIIRVFAKGYVIEDSYYFKQHVSNQYTSEIGPKMTMHEILYYLWYMPFSPIYLVAIFQFVVTIWCLIVSGLLLEVSSTYGIYGLIVIAAIGSFFAWVIKTHNHNKEKLTTQQEIEGKSE
jgi:hypothetical protein